MRIILLLLLFVTFSCSSDDDNNCGCRADDLPDNLMVGCPGEERIIPNTPEAIAEFCN